MKPEVDPSVAALLERVTDLSKWERSELGRTLRRAGWTYTEIGAAIPAAKSTIAGWCRDIALSESQVRAIRERTGSQAGIPRDTQWRRRQEVGAIERAARQSYVTLRQDPLWCLGTALYWGEGAKSKRELSITNSDPAIHRMFHRWVSRYLIADPEVVLHIHLHEGNDEKAARAWWSDALKLDSPEFDRTFVKPKRPGHRKNELPHGVARSRIRRSGDAWVTTMAWVGCLRLDSCAQG